MLPPASLLPQHQRMLVDLMNGSDFDRNYLRLQRATGNSAHDLHSRYLRDGASPTLKAVARRAVAVLKSELSALPRL